jgi:hypothetical protein
MRSPNAGRPKNSVEAGHDRTQAANPRNRKHALRIANVGQQPAVIVCVRPNDEHNKVGTI